jgi:hypothetical protein
VIPRAAIVNGQLLPRRAVDAAQSEKGPPT